MNPRLVIASRNHGKIREFQELLASSGWDVTTADDLGLTAPDPVEMGRTYLENALMKGAAYTRATQLPALADDSGLEVDALGGRPGVLSARYGSPAVRDDRGRTELLLYELEGLPPAQRTARFRCALVLAMPDGLWYVREGVLGGRIAQSPRGASGFGYDPVFEVSGRTLAEMGEEKQRISHRAEAVREMMSVLGELHDQFAAHSAGSAHGPR